MIPATGHQRWAGTSRRFDRRWQASETFRRMPAGPIPSSSMAKACCHSQAPKSGSIRLESGVWCAAIQFRTAVSAGEQSPIHSDEVVVVRQRPHVLELAAAVVRAWSFERD